MSAARRDESGLHEDYRRDTAMQAGSPRGFGLIVGGALVLIAGIPLFSGERPWLFPAGIGAALIAVALLAPRLLQPLNLAWTALGRLMQRVFDPIFLGFLFFCVITPVALAMRAAGKDPLLLKRDPTARSYWISREPPGPPPSGMKDQF